MSQKPDGASANGAIAERPRAPILLRFLGSDDGMLGVNGDYFTVGNTGDEDVPLPAAAGVGTPCKLRFSRAANGWRLNAADERVYFVNQQAVSGLTPLRSGDVIRLAPGAAGVQFAILHQGAEPLAKLVTRYAPRLLKADASARTQTPPPKKPDAKRPPAEPSDQPASDAPPPDGQPRPEPVLPATSSGTRETILFAVVMTLIGLAAGWLVLGQAAPSQNPSDAGVIESSESPSNDATLEPAATSDP